MTTSVIVSSPKPNHQRVRVRQMSPDLTHTYFEIVLEDGQSTVNYVHAGAVLLLDEVEIKDAPGS